MDSLDRNTSNLDLSGDFQWYLLDMEENPGQPFVQHVHI